MLYERDWWIHRIFTFKKKREIEFSRFYYFKLCIDLQSSLLTLGRVDASITPLSFNRSLDILQ